MLLSLLVFLVLAILMILICNNYAMLGQRQIQCVSLFISVVCFILSIFLWLLFDGSSTKYQHVTIFADFSNNSYFIWYLYKFNIFFGVDGISLFFILLTTFIVPLCLLTLYSEKYTYTSMYCLYVLLLELFLLLVFTALDILFFFIFFESVIIPMFFIISIWGSRERKIKAAFYFFFYTFAGSILLFFTVLVLYWDTGTTDLYILQHTAIAIDKQRILWFFVYLAFAIKIPIIPLHGWLPEAHVEAPTAGSVFLAGVLLKLGGYGIIRIILPIFPEATIYYLPLVQMLSVVSVLYASVSSIRQLDLKKTIAYSSIAHMNIVLPSVFSGTIEGVSGSVFLMLAHGMVSSALFFLVGILYDIFGTRLIYYYGGLFRVMPKYSTYLILFTFSNISVPGTLNFIGECVSLIGISESNMGLSCILASSSILSVLYMLFFAIRLIFFNLGTRYIAVYRDITIREQAILLPLLIVTVFFGIFPNILFDDIVTTVSSVIVENRLV